MDLAGHSQEGGDVVAYRIERTDAKGKTVACEVLAEQGRYRCRRSGRALPHCPGHATLKEALAAHPELTEVRDEDETSIVSTELPDYRIVPLLVPGGAPSLQVNGHEWAWGQSADPHVADFPAAARDFFLLLDGIDSHPDVQTDWLSLVWNEGPDRYGSGTHPQEGGEGLQRLGDFYRCVSDTEDHIFYFYCEEPLVAAGILLGLSAFGNLVSYLEGPVFDGQDEAVVADLLRYIFMWEAPHVVWVNRQLWERTKDGIQRKRPPDVGQLPAAPQNGLLLPEEILIGGEKDTEWVSIRPVEEAGVAETDSAAILRYRDSWVVSLPPIPAAQAVDPAIYEQLIEATYKYPGAGLSNSLPPYALVRFADGSVGYGVVTTQKEAADLLAAAFGSCSIYYMQADTIAVSSSTLSVGSPMVATVKTPPDDPAFMVRMAKWWGS